MARKTNWCGKLTAPLLAALLVGCGASTPPPDEGTERQFKGAHVTPAELQEAARKYYPPASENYFKDMDCVAAETPGATRPLELKSAEVIGRNAWVIWTGGNEAFWDWLARHGYGSIDLLKLIDSNQRGKRFARAGLLTEPGTRPPTDEETRQAHGVRYSRPDPSKHVEASLPEDRRPRPHIYGYPSGVVGLRLFPNPEFNESAKQRWDPKKYYEDPKYASHPDTIRPFRVGMSCGFCHIAPHPLRPPANPEEPEWANLSNNIGNQYLRFRYIFANALDSDNFLSQVIDAQLPGTIDTSLVSSDNINNANTINSFYGLNARVERANHNPKEVIGPATLSYLRKADPTFANPKEVPRVLLDGADSAGVRLALARVYLNIGTYHQQWNRLHNPLLGFRKQEPFKVKDCDENSLYWHATQLRVDPMAAFFKKATDPTPLRSAPDGVKLGGLKGEGRSSDPAYKEGRKVFARGCIACHSSIQPGDAPDLEKDLKVAKGGRDLKSLRLRMDDLARLTRGDGKLPPAYEQWALEVVEQPAFWEKNYLSTDVRIPVTLTRTNSARAMATNGLHGHMWEDFASQTYKELGPVGRVTYRDPLSAAEKSYEAPGGGRGYYRVPTLIGIWATAPFLHNNALGKFNNDPSVKGRLDAFDDAITRLLWPEKRLRIAPEDLSKYHALHQHLWPRDVGKDEPKSLDQLSKEERAELVKKINDQLAADGGLVWRTSQKTWVKFYGHQLPTLVAGVTGWSPFWVGLLPWLPSIAFVLLGVTLLLSGPLISFRERLEKRAPLLERLFGPVRWLLTVAALVLGVAAVYFVIRYWPTLMLLDVATGGSIPLLRLQALLIPAVFFFSVAVLFSLNALPVGGFRRRLTQVFGAACLLAAVAVALGFGQFFSGRGGDVTFGPIPAGVPVNALANLDPDAPFERRWAALNAVVDFALEHQRAEDGKKPGRTEFEERVAPAFMAASKCPDLVMDRGHDYELVRRLSDDQKRALIDLLKTF
jgi:hypothetical protein